MSLQFVIDGYNLIKHPLFAHANAMPRQRIGVKDERLALLEFIRVKRLTGSPKNEITVVFDGYPPGGTAGYVQDNISVIFSRKISADDRIKRLVEESVDPKNIIVVSDDREIKFIVKSLGARPVGIEEFINSKQKSNESHKIELIKPELSYSQIHKINQELSKIWLK